MKFNVRMFIISERYCINNSCSSRLESNTPLHIYYSYILLNCKTKITFGVSMFRLTRFFEAIFSWEAGNILLLFQLF